MADDPDQAPIGTADKAPSQTKNIANSILELIGGLFYALLACVLVITLHLPVCKQLTRQHCLYPLLRSCCVS